VPVLNIADKWFAWLMYRISDGYDGLLRDRKQRLLCDLCGTILEIGPGTGANLKYYGPGVRWIGFEPNLSMHAYVRREAAARNITIDLRQGAAERLDFEAGSADAVVSTLVLCSVEDLDRSLREARRVLKPGGRLVFIEHVAANARTALYRTQHFITPVWKWCAGGCHPARPTSRYLQNAGFREVQLEQFRLPLGPIAPHIAGIAIR
jgi:SAM-dependent methyltransferase